MRITKAQLNAELVSSRRTADFLMGEVRRLQAIEPEPLSLPAWGWALAFTALGLASYGATMIIMAVTS